MRGHIPVEGTYTGRDVLKLHVFTIANNRVDFSEGYVFDHDEYVDVTFDASADASRIAVMTESHEDESSNATLQIIKPGRGRYLNLEMSHRTILGEAVADLCKPWDERFRLVHYDWREHEGLYVQVENITWDTPECLSTYSLLENLMVLRARLHLGVASEPNSLGRLLDQEAAEYLHFVISTKSSS